MKTGHRHQLGHWEGSPRITSRTLISSKFQQISLHHAGNGSAHNWQTPRTAWVIANKLRCNAPFA